jgi:predicted MFS family arabinose efflux permease
MVAYARNLGLPATFVGVFYAAAGIGGALGAVGMGHSLLRLPYAAAVAIYALCVPLLGALSLIHDVKITLLVLAASTAAGTAGDVLFAVNVQRYVSPEERGRAFGLQFWFLPVGQLCGAVIGVGVDVHTAVPALLWVSGAVLPIILTGVLLSIRAGQPPGVVIRGAVAERVQ